MTEYSEEQKLIKTIEILSDIEPLIRNYEHKGGYTIDFLLFGEYLESPYDHRNAVPVGWKCGEDNSSVWVRHGKVRQHTYRVPEIGDTEQKLRDWRGVFEWTFVTTKLAESVGFDGPVHCRNMHSVPFVCARIYLLRVFKVAATEIREHANEYSGEAYLQKLRLAEEL